MTISILPLTLPTREEGNGLHACVRAVADFVSRRLKPRSVGDRNALRRAGMRKDSRLSSVEARVAIHPCL